MQLSFVSISEFLRHPKKIFTGEPFQIILSNNKPKGMYINQKTADMMMRSGIFQDILDEIEELEDKELVDVIESYHNGTAKPVPFDSIHPREDGDI